MGKFVPQQVAQFVPVDRISGPDEIEVFDEGVVIAYFSGFRSLHDAGYYHIRHRQAVGVLTEYQYLPGMRSQPFPIASRGKALP